MTGQETSVLDDDKKMVQQKEREIVLMFPLTCIVTDGTVEGSVIGHKIDHNGQSKLYLRNGDSVFYIFADRCKFSEKEELGAIAQKFPINTHVALMLNGSSASGMVIGYRREGEMWLLLVEDINDFPNYIYEYPPKEWKVIHHHGDVCSASEDPFNRIKGVSSLESIFSENGKTE